MAITEKYFSPNYFDKSLTGARADQEVLKELVSRKLPDVHRHLDSIDVELSTISLNWFLAMFFDAVPFQVLTRKKWGLAQSPSCDCGQRQTMSHIVDMCPLTKFKGGLNLLHEADDDAVIWLEATATAALAK